MALAEFTKKFDRVFCISLPNSINRREHILNHFTEMGIDRYEFFDATDKSDAVVSEYFSNGKVAKYPPCFRCGKLSCGDDKCNNVLIPQQVATFIIYLRLWKKIVDENIGTALIVEDDVQFTDYADEISSLRGDIFSQAGFLAQNPVWLRLGWALCEEHEQSKTMKLEHGVIRMSNPCHAVTKKLAGLLLSSFRKIDTTVDIYQHNEFEKEASTYTLFPPLAYELSWSTGEMSSLIHPKPIRAEYLRKNDPDNSEGIQFAEKAVEEHISHILYRPLLIVGHPRCGSGYMSRLLMALGLDVGHERMGKHGISSWMFAVFDQNPYSLDKYSASRNLNHFEFCIHHVRDPKMAVPSIMRENRYSELSFEFRSKHIKQHFGVDLQKYSSEIERAVLSYIYWNKIISKCKVDLIIRVEDADRYLADWLVKQKIITHRPPKIDFPKKNIKSGKPYKGVVYKKPQISEKEWNAISQELLMELNAQCQQYGYGDFENIS